MSPVGKRRTIVFILCFNAWTDIPYYSLEKAERCFLMVSLRICVLQPPRGSLKLIFSSQWLKMFCVHTCPTLYMTFTHVCCMFAAVQADFLFFSSPQSWFLWQGLSESTAKIVSWKLEFLENKHITTDYEQTADTKKVFLSRQHYSKYYYRTWNPPLRSKRTPNPTQFEHGTFIPLYAGSFNEI